MTILLKIFFSKYKAALAHFYKQLFLLLGCPIQKVLRIALVLTLAVFFCLFGLYVNFESSSFDSVLISDFPFLESERIDEYIKNNMVG